MIQVYLGGILKNAKWKNCLAERFSRGLSSCCDIKSMFLWRTLSSTLSWLKIPINECSLVFLKGCFPPYLYDWFMLFSMHTVLPSLVEEKVWWKEELEFFSCNLTGTSVDIQSGTISRQFCHGFAITQVRNRILWRRSWGTLKSYTAWVVWEGNVCFTHLCSMCSTASTLNKTWR